MRCGDPIGAATLSQRHARRDAALGDDGCGRSRACLAVFLRGARGGEAHGEARIKREARAAPHCAVAVHGVVTARRVRRWMAQGGSELSARRLHPKARAPLGGHGRRRRRLGWLRRRVLVQRGPSRG